MSVVFVVASEEQLRTGIPWCKMFAENSRTAIHVVVVGTDRKVLLEHARRQLADALDQPLGHSSVTAVESNAEAVLAFLKSVRCSRLAMVYGEDGKLLQQTLFERSSAAAFWLQSSGPPPASQRLFAAMKRDIAITTTVSEKLFGFAPAAVLPDPFGHQDDCSGEATEKVLAEIGGSANQSGDLVLVGIRNATRGNAVYTVGLELLENNCDASVALVHDGDSLQESLGSKVKDWFSSIAPPMDRQQRQDLASDLEFGSKPNLEFLGLISAAAMLAAFGLVQNSAAVIIGAMLIAPLMTPIVGAGLALTHGNLPLFKTAISAIAVGFFGALTASVLFGLLVRFGEVYLHLELLQQFDKLTEMRARCNPSPLDFCVGLVGGMAASYARTRSHLSSALAGAAIAAALVPPIATAGLHLAFQGWDRSPSKLDVFGLPVIAPMLLVSVNVLTIMIGSSFVLWARGMRTDRKLSIKDRWAPRMVTLLLLATSLAMVTIVYG